MALYIPHSIFHLSRLLYVRPETFGPYYVHIYIMDLKTEDRKLMRRSLGYTHYLFCDIKDLFLLRGTIFNFSYTYVQLHYFTYN